MKSGDPSDGRDTNDSLRRYCDDPDRLHFQKRTGLQLFTSLNVMDPLPVRDRHQQ